MPLHPAEQNRLLGEITTLLLQELPQGWQRLILDYTNIGRYVGVATGVRMADGTTQRWAAPKTTAPLFSRLRHGMYTEERGTWYSLELTVDPPDHFSVKFNWNNAPNLRSELPSEQYAVDHQRYPRAEAHMPAWFRQHLAAAGPA